MEQKLQEVLKDCQIKDYIGLLNNNVTSVEYDSRKCKNGSCFVAIKGNNFDGHNYIQQATDNGATAIICQNYPELSDIKTNITYILVDNSKAILAKIAHNFYNNPTNNLIVIGITGTNGKTTTSYIIKSIIESANNAVGIIGTTGIYFGNKKIDTNLTTPESSDLARIFYEMLQSGIKYVVMEVSSVALIMHRVDCIKFKVAGFSNLTQDHLDIHQNMENYADAKKLLFDNLLENSIAVVNSDSKYSEYMLKDCHASKIIRVGRNSNADYKIIKESKKENGNSFLLFGKHSSINVISKLSGSFNIDNCALSATICDVIKIPQVAIQKGLSLSIGAPGRLQRVVLKNKAIAYVDYAHTPDALEKSLLTMNEFANEHQSNVICVFGCGGNRDKAKRPLMGTIAEKLSDMVIITNDNPRSELPQAIFDDIMHGINNSSKVRIVEDRHQAINEAYKSSKVNDFILVAGKGHETYQIIGKEYTHFDDIEELQKLAL
ncbi:MAG TPA: UDP-N-acetylmuramoyl-L-alanyl-D-glutamate--2,6-diaminopimelate ligase [Candidatus Kapabacteria bacterium]|nr:UDP-N-acetylmuramoyl-L-alanyl-D-glutamate--2,6-diaminopimelate ligase [Candidatus Kapabacteria bacterium]